MMNKKNVIIAVLAICATTVLNNCDSTPKKIEVAQKNVDRANKDLERANKKYLSEVENYRKETTQKTEANKKTIADFNEKLAKEKKAVKTEYELEIAKLNKQNSDLMKKMEAYESAGEEKWETFKLEINRDLDELAKAVLELTAEKKK